MRQVEVERTGTSHHAAAAGAAAARTRVAAAVDAPHSSPAAAVLALQQTAGNRATTRFLSRQPHTVHKPLADIVRLRTLAEHAKDRRDLLASYIKAARDDLKRYRDRFREVDKRYTAAYEMYKGTLKTMNASADTEQFIVNQVFSLLNNLTVGTLGNALQEAKLVGAATNLYGGAAVNTAIGNLAPQIPKAEVSEELNPALHRAEGLQMLDDLNAIVLSIAADGMMPVTEPMELAQKLIAEVRVDTARGKRELSDEQFKQELARLEGYESRGVDFIVAALRGHQQLDKLRALFNRSPFPSQRQCEQDIWITWMSHQDPGWGFNRWTSVLGRPELHNRLIAVGLATRDIGLTPPVDKSENGGRLGVATNGMTDRVVHGQIMSKDPAHWLRDASLNELKYVAQYWSSVFLASEPPPYANEER